MLTDIANYTSPTPSLWQGRIDSLPGERFFQRIECVDVSKQTISNNDKTIILGYSCDEGVRRNLGETGAKEGPDAIREQLAKFACHHSGEFIDIGNIVCEDHHLEGAQDNFATLISLCHKNGHKTIGLGGSHDIAWAHYRGLAEHYPTLGIINFDAHFDIRPQQHNQGSSGTPFAQIHDYCKAHDRVFNYCCIGIQPVANTKSLFDRAHEWDIPYLTAAQMNNESLAWQMAFLDTFILNHDALYLTICLDVFDESFAPGVSAPQAMGINPWQALPLLKYIKQSGKVVSIDIAELAPPLDTRHKTARLGARLLAELLNVTKVF